MVVAVLLIKGHVLPLPLKALFPAFHINRASPSFSTGHFRKCRLEPNLGFPSSFAGCRGRES